MLESKLFLTIVNLKLHLTINYGQWNGQRSALHLLGRYKEFFERSRGELAARVFEKQAGLELQREERREEVVKSKRKALEVRKN